MTEFTIDPTTMEVAAPPPPTALVGGEFSGHDDHMTMMMLSPAGYNSNINSCWGGDTSNFLRSCGLCNRGLSPGRDIYMYRGDSAFCSPECREQQMKQDERKERRAAAATAVAKNGESHHKQPVTATPETESVAAA